ncbi:hypothetical protein [Streptomyces sp. NBC_00091]|uniref:hypothetical protein n=1 Tax=Streptomyces sp. NBC_00091 TaxID=2975648 RepID=UPI00224DD19C|nr:hypothetical protein [Streptomyces sp. NBC_00091]MCX5377950.1 hypothetical protein [Streptomyces sp. NBC_00091]
MIKAADHHAHHMPAASIALVCAALLTATGCGPVSGKAAADPSPTASTAPDPLAGKDPAAVLRAAYEETERADSKNAAVQRTIGDRQISAHLSFEGDSACWGKVTVMRAGVGEILMDDGRLSLKGDAGFLQDQFRDSPVKSADTDEGWIDIKPSDPSVAHLLALCKEGSAARTFPAERTDIRREADTYRNGKPVAVFKSKVPGGAEITDHVRLEGTPYLLKHWRSGGPDSGAVEYTGVRRTAAASPTGPAGAVSEAPSTLGA